ncbi:hypothetical protein FQA39_LY10929 [Lamprigera yunnana]|nr:hypothetical protein FQA39_LY10929 [Lamprigera yunnana]
MSSKNSNHNIYDYNIQKEENSSVSGQHYRLDSADNQEFHYRTLSWHEHVYRKLSNKPTPHFIENILGIQNSSSQCNEVEQVLNIPKMPMISATLVSDYVLHSPHEVNEPLNLSIRCDKLRCKTNCKDSIRKRKKNRDFDGKLVTTAAAVSPANSLAEDGDSKKKKKARTTFTGRQIFELEKQFEIKKYLSSSERSEMAKLLNVTETQTCDMMWKPKQIGSKTLTFKMIEENKILRIEDVRGNEVYLGSESVSEV